MSHSRTTLYDLKITELCLGGHLIQLEVKKDIDIEKNWVGHGGTCLVYRAVEKKKIENNEVSQNIILKEFYPKLNDNEAIFIKRKSDGSFEVPEHAVERDSEYQIKLERFKSSYEKSINLHNYKEMNNYTVMAYDFVHENGTYYIMMDYDASAEFSERIEKYNDLYKYDNLYDFLRIIKQIALALLNLHKIEYLHLDLKPDNFLILDTNTVKVMDTDSFILKKEFKQKDSNGNYKKLSISYSEGFTAPEIYKFNGTLHERCMLSEHGEKSDIYSLGAIIFYYFFKKAPNVYDDGIIDETYKYEKEIENRLSMYSYKDRVLIKNMLRKMLSYLTFKRYKSMTDVIATIDRILPEKKMDISNGIDEYHMWEGSLHFLKRNYNLFNTEHIPTSAKNLKIKNLDIYGRLNEREPCKLQDIFSKIFKNIKSENLNVYLQAPGGGGKSFAVSEIFKKYINTGELIPLYIDLTDYKADILENAKSYEFVIPQILAFNLFESHKRIDIERIYTLLKELKGKRKKPRFVLILDNLHKVPLSIYNQAIASINTVSNEFRNAWLIVCGRTNKNYIPNMTIKNEIHIELLSTNYMQEKIEETIGRKLSDQEINMICAQHRKIGIPFLFMRYLEVSLNNVKKPTLPPASNVMNEYFSEYENGNHTVQTVEFDRLLMQNILRKYLPEIAYKYMISGISKCNVNMIYKWLPKKFTQEEKERILKICTNALAVLLIKDENIINFTHDCYEEYFSSVFISKRWEYVLEENLVQGFQNINHIWNSIITSDSIDLIEIEDEREKIINDTYEIINNAYEKLNNQENYSDLYAANISYNIWDLFNSYNRLEALRWLILGATIGQSVLQFHLGRIYGMEKDIDKEIEWYTCSAKNGYTEAQYALGMIFSKGKGKIVKNSVEAEKWLTQAAKSEHLNAQYALGMLYYNKNDVVIADYIKAREWFEKAAINGHMNAQYVLGNLYYEGKISAESDFEKGVFWYQKAAAQGHAGAQFKLGNAYFNGQGVSKDEELAAFWYAKAEDGTKLTKNYNYLINNIYPDAKNLIKYKNTKENKPKELNETIFTFPIEYYDISNLHIEIIDNPDKKYIIPNFIKENYQNLLSAHNRSKIYDAENIRVDDWKFCDDKFQIFTSRTKYFDSLVTNRVADLKLKNGKTVRTELDPGPVPKTLADSPFSNHIGYNGFIRSKDGYIPFVKRGINVSVEKGVYGNSIQASLKTRYALENKNKLDLSGIIYSIICEIEDELKIAREDLKKDPKLLYAYRNLVEGSKPQFVFYVESSKTKNEIEENFIKNLQEKQKKDDLLIDGDKLLWIHETELSKIFIKPDGIIYGKYNLEMVPSASGALVMLIWYLQNNNLI